MPVTWKNDDPPNLHGAAQIDYTNWRGERSVRVVIPLNMKLGSNEWHPEPQWMMLAHDVAKKADRWFAMSGIHSWCTPEIVTQPTTV